MPKYETLRAWQLCDQLAHAVYDITQQWPASERYELTRQARRAALAAPTNLAEGVAKRGPSEFRRYADIALGSLSELRYELRFAKDRKWYPVEEWQQVDGLLRRAGGMTWRLSQSLRPKARQT